jgi:hypothetical protein
MKSQKSLKCLAKETGISKSPAAIATKELKLQPYKATGVHALQPYDLANGINLKDEVYRMNPHTKEELEENI